MTPLIECRDLTKSFGGTLALDRFSLTVNPGVTVGLVGPNGAGKTTFFSILSGFLNPTSGTVRVLGHRPNSSTLKGRIGILPQDAPFMAGVSVKSQMTLYARLQGLNKQAAKNEVDRILELVSAIPLAKQLPETLSHGQRKRITIAQALIARPELILLDEPTSGLDPVAANEVRSLVQRLSQTSTFMVSSHNLDEIEDICNDIILIDKGELVSHCPISELVEQNNCLTLLLNQIVSDEIKSDLTHYPEISRLEPDASNPQRLTIYFKSDRPDDLQIKVLETIQKHSVSVIELNRGAVLADKVITLVKDR